MTLTCIALLVILMVALTCCAHFWTICREQYRRSAAGFRESSRRTRRIGHRRFHPPGSPQPPPALPESPAESPAVPAPLSRLAASGLPVALITGASGGIGSALACGLAQRRYATVLLGRDQARLTSLSAELQSRFGLPSACLPGDLSSPGVARSIAHQIRQEHLNLEVLVNAAGFAIRGRFDATDTASLLEMLQVNILALTELTSLLLPAMLLRRCGYILNLASVASFMPGPLLAAYFASKAYVLSFSEALAQELIGTGISVTAVCPGPTRTGFARRAGLEATRAFRGKRPMDPERVAKRALQALFHKKRVVIPSLPLRLELLPAHFLPRRLLAAIAAHYHTLPEDTAPLPTTPPPPLPALSPAISSS